MDGYHLAGAELSQIRRAAREGPPDSFDPAGQVALAQRLGRPAPRETAYLPAFYRNIDTPIGGEVLLPAVVQLSVTEGNYLLLDNAGWAGARPFMDDAWLVNVDPAQRHRRLLQRHRRFGSTREDAMAWLKHTDEPNALRIAATAVRADFRFGAEIGCPRVSVARWRRLRDRQSHRYQKKPLKPTEQRGARCCHADFIRA